MTGRARFVQEFPSLSGPHQTEPVPKSISAENWLSQIRSAVSQLYEYRYIHELKQAKLCLVLSSPPPEQWIISYLEEDRSIHLCWLSSAGDFDGPGWRLLFDA